MTIVAICTYKCQNFSQNKLCLKNTKVDIENTNNISFNSLFLHSKKDLKQQKFIYQKLNMNCFFNYADKDMNLHICSQSTYCHCICYIHHVNLVAGNIRQYIRN